MFISPNPFSLEDVLFDRKALPFSGAPWMSKENDRILFYSRGQWALSKLGASIARKRNRSKGRIFVPEYFCEISLTTLRFDEFDIRFYRITERLEPDITDLEKLVADDEPPDMLLFVHYFGIPVNMSSTEAWCRKNGIVLIEDAAHSLIPVPGIGDHGCPVVYTPWKFFNIPDGALLVLPEGSSDIFSTVEEHDDPYPLAWFVKRLSYAATQTTGLPLHRIRPFPVKACEESEPPIDPGRPGCRSRSVAILAKKEKHLLSVGRVREQNYRQLDGAISGSSLCGYRMFQALPARFTPYVYPLRIAGGDCRGIMVALNKIGIPAQPWSDLSPEVKNSAAFPLSNSLRKEVMVLPVHQDLAPRQIVWMAGEVIREIARQVHPQ